MAYAGADIGNDAVAAIVSNIWSSTEDNDQLEFIIMECEQGKVVVTKVSEVLLCLIGSEIAEFGMLKAKVDLFFSLIFSFYFLFFWILIVFGI